MLPRSLLLLSVLLAPHCFLCQRLSTGASDWYMRFHDFDDLVKRHVDRPATRSFYVHTDIRHRYAVTTVRAVLHNPASVGQVFRFGFAMPADALVTAVKLARDSDYDSVSASFNRSAWPEVDGMRGGVEKDGYGYYGGEAEEDRMAHGTPPPPAGNYMLDSWLGIKQFVLPARILPRDNVTLSFSYEHLLERKNGRYEYTASVSPGEVVHDFRYSLAIKEELPLVNLSVRAPVVGELEKEGGKEEEGVCEVSFGMSVVEQYDYFGSHGFTGDISVSYDVDTDGGERPDLIVDGESFLHFYQANGGVEDDDMKSIPRHVIFVVDDSESMSGPKAEHARRVVRFLSTNLSDTDYISMLVFNDSSVEAFVPDSHRSNYSDVELEAVVPHAFSVNNNTTEELLEGLDSLGSSTGASNLSVAIDEALRLDAKVWQDGALPENAYTIVVVLTDGRSQKTRAEKRRVVEHVRRANRASRIPVFLIGVGFDADMDYLGEISERCGGFTVNVIEDLDVAPQLAPFQVNLDEVVLKNLHLSYIGDAFVQESLTNTHFVAYRARTSVAVAGKLRLTGTTNPEFEMEATAQSTEGLFMDHPATLSLSDDKQCSGQITLCSETHLSGDCVTVTMSRSSLTEFGFGNRAVSANVTGDCAWAAHSEAYYAGRVFMLVPGQFDFLPDTMHKAISSLKVRTMASFAPATEYDKYDAVEEEEEDDDDDDEKLDQGSVDEMEIKEGGAESDTFVTQGESPSSTSSLKDSPPPSSSLHLSRVRAYMIIRDVLRRLELRPESVTWTEIDAASDAALEHGFLTPFTDMNLEDARHDDDDDYDAMMSEPSPSSLLETSLLTYHDLTPVLLSLDDDPHIKRQWEALQQCLPPIHCVGNFHFELMPEEVREDEEEEEMPKESELWGKITRTTL